MVARNLDDGDETEIFFMMGSDQMTARRRSPNPRRRSPNPRRRRASRPSSKFRASSRTNTRLNIVAINVMEEMEEFSRGYALLEETLRGRGNGLLTQPPTSLAEQRRVDAVFKNLKQVINVRAGVVINSLSLSEYTLDADDIQRLRERFRRTLNQLTPNPITTAVDIQRWKNELVTVAA